MEPLHRKTGHTHESTENMLQILLTRSSWAEIRNSVFPLHSSSNSSSPALFQLLPSAAGEVTEPGQAGAVLGWAQLGTLRQQEQTKQCSHSCSLQNTKVFAWVSQITWEKGAWMQMAVQSVSTALALSAVEQSTGSH